MFDRKMGLSQNDENIEARQPPSNIEGKEIRDTKKEYNKQSDPQVAQKKRIYRTGNEEITRLLASKERGGFPNGPLWLYGEASGR